MTEEPNNRVRLLRDDLDKFFEYGVHLPSRTIYCGSITTDVEGDESGIDAAQAGQVIKAIHHLSINESVKNAKPIKLILNSPGGDEYHGWGIYDAVKDSKCPVDIECYGNVMSSGAIIMQAGRKRVLHRNAVVMVHDGETSFTGSPRSFEAWADFYRDHLRPRMYKVFAERSGDSTSYWRRKCSHDFILTAEEAVEEGLADRVFGTRKKFVKGERKMRR